jgi:transposase
MGKALRVILTDEQRETLTKWVRSGTTEKRLAERSRIILASSQGKSPREVARQVGVTYLTVYKWRRRFRRDGIAGLQDAPRPGPERKYDSSTEKRILAMLDKKPPEGYASWNGTLLSRALGDVSKDQVWRVLRHREIYLQRKRSWCISTDPQFAQKAADIVALYLDPPENAVVICVDEKPSIQALERAQGWLKLPNGKSLRGYSHEYTRHGTTTLFAALEVATGLVRAGHYNRRRRKEFLHFMNEIIEDYHNKEIHVVLDNLSTHKPKHDRWLQRHKNVYIHYTPTHASWLNQIEVWFSILTRQALKGASFTSPADVRQAIDKFIAVHNRQASPFEWTKKIVYSVAPQKHYTNLRK